MINTNATNRIIHQTYITLIRSYYSTTSIHKTYRYTGRYSFPLRIYVSVRKHKKVYSLSAVRAATDAVSVALVRASQRRCEYMGLNICTYICIYIYVYIYIHTWSKRLSGCMSESRYENSCNILTGKVCFKSSSMIFAVAYFHLEIDSPSENGSYTRPLVRPLLLYPRTPPKSSLSPHFHLHPARLGCVRMPWFAVLSQLRSERYVLCQSALLVSTLRDFCRLERGVVGGL